MSRYLVYSIGWTEITWLLYHQKLYFSNGRATTDEDGLKLLHDRFGYDFMTPAEMDNNLARQPVHIIMDGYCNVCKSTRCERYDE